MSEKTIPVKILILPGSEAYLLSLQNELVACGFSPSFIEIQKAEGLPELQKAPDVDFFLFGSHVALKDIGQICRSIREQPSTRLIPIVFWDDHTTGIEHRAKAVGEGCDAVLASAGVPGELAMQINQLLKSKAFNKAFSFSGGGTPLALMDHISLIAGKVFEHSADLLGMIERDITDFTSNAMALAESEKQFREIFNSTSEAIIIDDGEVGLMVDCNDRALEMYGYGSKTEFLAKRIEEISAGSFADTSKIIHEIRHRCLQEGTVTFEWEARRKDGTTFWVEICLRSTQIGGAGRVLAVIRDIEGRKRAEELIRRHEGRLQSVFKVSPIGIGLVVDRILLDVNDYFCNLVGYSRNELIGKSSRMLYASDEEFAAVGATKYEQIREKGIGSVETQFITKGGEVVDVLLSSTLIEQGNPAAGVTFTALDITEQLRADRALRHSEFQFRALANSGNALIWQSGTDKACFYFNEPWLQFTGRTLEEEVGNGWVEGVHPEDLERCVSIYSTAFDQQNQFEMEYRLKHHSGEYRWIVDIGTPNYNQDGEFIGYIGHCFDVTDRKNSELVLHQSEEKYRSLIHQMQLGLALHEMIYDEQGNAVDYRFLEVNPGFEKITGLLRDELIGKTVYEVLPDTERFWLESYERVLRTGKTIALKNYSKELDRHYHVVAYKHREHEFAVICDDITDQVKAEEKLIEASNNWKRTFNAMHSGIVLLDAEQNILQCNKAFLDLVGMTEAEVNNNRLCQYLDCASESHGDCPVIRMSKTRSREASEMIIGDRVYEVTVDPIFDHNAHMTGAVHIMTDISRRKHDETVQQILYEVDKTAMLTNSLEEILVIVRNELSKVIDTTNFFMALYNPETDMFSTVMGNDEKDELLEWPAEGSLSGQVVKLRKTLLVKHGGLEEHQISNASGIIGSLSACWLGVPLTISDRSMGVIVVQSYDDPAAYNESSARLLEMISHDLTNVIERKQMIDDLVRSKEHAEESDRLKSAFLANMSHEIRTPMNGIMGFTSLLKEPGFSSEEKQEFLEIIQTSGERMLCTVNDLIDISRIETGQMQVIMTETNFRTQISNLWRFFLPQAKEKGLLLLLNDRVPDASANIVTDVSKLDSILTNLIRNAIKFTEKGVIEIGCSVKDHKIECYVKDTGIGVPEDKTEAIFNRFEQADLVNRHAYEGSGLGLTIAKAYVEMLGGKIWLESSPGKGSTFHFTIALNQKPERLVEVQETVSQSSFMDYATKPLNIMIADDDLASVQYLSVLLKHEHIKVLYCKNGLEAVEQCRMNPNLDLILMDIKMPEMDGYEATRAIRTFNQQVIIIAQTAYALGTDRARALAAGCNEHIFKPIHAETLLNMIGKFCNSEAERQKAASS